MEARGQRWLSAGAVARRAAAASLRPPVTYASLRDSCLRDRPGCGTESGPPAPPKPEQQQKQQKQQDVVDVAAPPAILPVLVPQARAHGDSPRRRKREEEDDVVNTAPCASPVAASAAASASASKSESDSDSDPASSKSTTPTNGSEHERKFYEEDEQELGPAAAAAGESAGGSAGESARGQVRSQSCDSCGSCPGCASIELKRGFAFGDETFLTIVKDVPRSYGSTLRLLDSPAARSALTEVLVVFSAFKPDVGYTQGMNFICAVALGHMGAEDAFWLLVDLVESLPTGFFHRTARDEVDLFAEVVSSFAPVIREHLHDMPDMPDMPDGAEAHAEGACACSCRGRGRSRCCEDVHRAVGYLLVQWLVPVFVHVLPLETTLRVWDFLFEHKARDQGRAQAQAQAQAQTQAQTQAQAQGGLILTMHRVAFALVEVHSGPLISDYRQAKEALVALRQRQHQRQHQRQRQGLGQGQGRRQQDPGAEGEEEAEVAQQEEAERAALVEVLENSSGVGFVKRVLVAASKDDNASRIVALAKEVTIDPAWLHLERAKNEEERSRLAEQEQEQERRRAARESESESESESEPPAMPVAVPPAIAPMPRPESRSSMHSLSSSLTSSSRTSSSRTSASRASAPRPSWRRYDEDEVNLLACIGIRDKASNAEERDFFKNDAVRARAASSASAGSSSGASGLTRDREAPDTNDCTIA